MKIVILAGGRPSTISSDSEGIPKPMIEIGGKPLLWHIMKHFSLYGFNEFIVCGGYKVDVIKDYFMDYYIYESDITVDLQSNSVTIHKKRTEDWKVTVVDTGLETATAARVERIKDYIGTDTFIVTYGDCLTDLNVNKLVETHEKVGKSATMVTSRTVGRNELVSIGSDGQILGKASDSIKDAWVNGCIYVLDHRAFGMLSVGESLEKSLMKAFVPGQELMAYRYDGFRVSVETYRDYVMIKKMCDAGNMPWLDIVE
jgi:glucose-1-phosphate cytidylyltransferase